MRRSSRAISSYLNPILLILIWPYAVNAQSSDTIRYDIPAEPLEHALTQFGIQSKRQVIFDPAKVPATASPGLRGVYTVEAALRMLLSGSGLEFSVASGKTIVVQPITRRTDTTAASARSLQLSQEPQAPDPASNARAGADGAQPKDAIPEILVKGSRSLDTDIVRTVDDAQPYVVFDRAALATSGAANLEEFFRDRLPMNTQPLLSSQGGMENRSQINLRGLGADQTLILVDGRRMASPSFTGAVGQPDLNGIPLAAIERIEILPTTASGIYGGGATGGVINVILRHDYSGVETKATYGHAFGTGAGTWRADLSAGFNLNQGRTNIIVSASDAHSDALQMQDRNLLSRGRDILLQRNPAALLFGGYFPPLGATTNIRSADGSPLFGPGTASFTSVPDGYAGGGGLAPLAVHAGQYNLALANTAQNAGGEFDLLSETNVQSIMSTIRQEISDHARAFVEASFSRNRTDTRTSNTFSDFTIPAAAPNNPFGQDVIADVPVAAGGGTDTDLTDAKRIVGGLIVDLGHDWSAEADYTWNASRIESGALPIGLTEEAAAAVASGAIDVLRDLRTSPVDFSPFVYGPYKISPFKSDSKDATLRIAGPILELPAGAVKLTTLVEHRRESFDAATDQIYPGGPGDIYPGKSQSVSSVYIEASMPLVSARNAVPGVKELELQLAGRYDDYKVNGTTAIVSTFPGAPTDPIVAATNSRSSMNPTFALRFKPFEDLMIRASFGTGFLPPSVTQLASSHTSGVTTVVDPLRGGEFYEIPAGSVIGGGNAALRPEKSQSFSIGTVLTPRWIPGLRLSADYTRINKRDVIANLTTDQIILNAAAFPGRVTRTTPAAGDPYGVGRITFIDASAINVSRAKIESVDFQLDYHHDVPLGTFDFSSIATLLPSYKTQLLPADPMIENVGIESLAAFSNTGIALKFKGNLSAQWTYRAVTLGWNTRYFSSYALDNSYAVYGPAYDYVTSNGGPRVANQTYHDLYVRYRFQAFGVLKNAEAQFGVWNVFDKAPPFDPDGGVGLYSGFGDPRLRRYELSLRASF